MAHLQGHTSVLDLIVQGDLVLPGGLLPDGAVGILDGRIAAISGPQALPPHRARIDVRGRYVFAGFVDAHVHCYSTPNEGFTAATRSAAAGGVTTIIEMPYDLGRPVISLERFLDKQARLEAESLVDVALLATIKKTGGLDQIPLMAQAGACGFKMSLYETDPDRFPRIPDFELLQAFALIRQTGLPVGLHAENDELVQWATHNHRASGDDARTHCHSRPPITESSAVLKALEFAHETGVHLHIYHASLARTFELLNWYRQQGTRVTAETCPHYLALAEKDMDRLGARAKINPPLRAAGEGEKLWALCAAGQVDLITSDHAPWSLEHKSRPNIFDNASGAPGVETLAPLVFSEGVAKGRLTVHDMARLLAQRPAEVFGLAPRKGSIRVGADADLTVIDPSAEWTLDERRLHSSAGWSPYDGWPLKGRISHTIVRGQVVFDGDRVTAEPGSGRFVPGQPITDAP
ncbi:MAG: dihydroorotase [Chloroflexota bacterium]